MPEIKAADLIALEHKYSAGQVTRGIKPWEPSPYDPKGSPLRIHDGHRMGPRKVGLEHNYAPVYAHYLSDRRVGTLVEMGVLRGLGLAIWVDLFPQAHIIGLDWDWTAYQEHLPKLLQLGAFSQSLPRVYRFDELDPKADQMLHAITPGGIDVFIDDALHYDDAIIQAFVKFFPILNKGGVYFIEDNARVIYELRRKFPELRFNDYKEMTVIVKE